jgi:membrane associated rhomboid family serine protease
MYGRNGGGLLASLPPALRLLLLTTAGVFVGQLLVWGFFPPERGFYPVDQVYLGLVPALVVSRGFVWQLFTYQFLHGGFGHIVINMFILWMFGRELEQLWGSGRFLRYYLICGIGGGVANLAMALVPAVNPLVPVVGASGAVLGVLLAYGLLFPNRRILFWGVFPIRARTLVFILVIVDLLFAVWSQQRAEVAHFAHLGGMATGYFLLRGTSGLSRLLGGGGGRKRSRRFRVVRDPRDDDPHNYH